MTAKQILDSYVKFFEERGHTRIENSSLVPLNDPTTLFTSSGMQPLVSYLLGEPHPQGVRLVNAQNSFRAVDIDEVGDNRHTTFFRMLGNWSLGDYFKKEQIPWFFEFLTKELKLNPEKLFVTVFSGFEGIPEDEESISVWQEEFKKVGIDAKLGERIFKYGVEKNWWSRAGVPDKMPVGEPGGPDTEVFYELPIEHDKKFGEKCHVNCDCGKYVEIGNSVFMQYMRTADGFDTLSQKNVDFGGGLERLLMASENKHDIFETSLFFPIIKSIEKETGKNYASNEKEMRIISDHFTAAVFIISNDVVPSNKEQGYILRRLIRRGLGNFYILGGKQIETIIEAIVGSYKDTDQILVEKYEPIKGVILEEEQSYARALEGGSKMIQKELKMTGEKLGDDLMGQTEITADLAFKAITSFGLGPTQLKSLGYVFDEQALAEQIKAHQDLSRKGASQKFAGGLADHSEKTIMGHTATHLLHQALRDMLGKELHQTGSNITSERVRFDFNFDRKLILDELRKVEDTVNEKIKDNLPVYFEIMPIEKAKEKGAIGLFDEKYAKDVKVYFIGEFSKELCGGPHVNFTGEIKRFTIIKQESLGRGQQRIYSTVG